MAENTKIEWAHHTFNPWLGCTKVGPGCDNCYAEKLVTGRMGKDVWGPGKPRALTSESNWKQPLRWNKKAAELGVRHRVFCASLADVFDDEVSPDWRLQLWYLINATPNLDWLLLTKRIGNAKTMWPAPIDGVPLSNVWLGATVVNQAEADRDIPKLLATPARVRFLSMEPLLGPVDIRRWLIAGANVRYNGQSSFSIVGYEPRLDWVIAGGESGKDARPMHPDWARDLRDQCETAGVPFLFKQWGEWAPGENAPATQKRTENVATWSGVRWLFDQITPGAGVELHADDEPDVWRFGKKAAGRHLDGQLHDGVPA